MAGWTEFRVFWRLVTFKMSLSYQQRKHYSLWWQVDKGTLSPKSFYYKTTLPRRLGPPTCTLKTQLRSVSDPDTCPLDVSVTERKHCRPGQKKTSTFPFFFCGKDRVETQVNIFETSREKNNRFLKISSLTLWYATCRRLTKKAVVVASPKGNLCYVRL